VRQVLDQLLFQRLSRRFHVIQLHIRPAHHHALQVDNRHVNQVVSHRPSRLLNRRHNPHLLHRIHLVSLLIHRQSSVNQLVVQLEEHTNLLFIRFRLHNHLLSRPDNLWLDLLVNRLCNQLRLHLSLLVNQAVSLLVNQQDNHLLNHLVVPRLNQRIQLLNHPVNLHLNHSVIHRHIQLHNLLVDRVHNQRVDRVLSRLIGILILLLDNHPRNLHHLLLLNRVSVLPVLLHLLNILRIFQPIDHHRFLQVSRR
jgi:hypothetical protein